jgi:hypothetical protein
MLDYNEDTSRLVDAMTIEHPNGFASPKQIFMIAKQEQIPIGTARQFVNSLPSVEHGIKNFAVSQTLTPADRLPGMYDTTAPITSKTTSTLVMSAGIEDVHIPKVDKDYIRWGHFKDIALAVSKRVFFPIFITGLSGNGKTMMVEQACAKEKRQYMRVQISPETDEDDLLGGFRLEGGETVFTDGPVIRAMRAGAVLCLDEIDRGSNRIMCLQGVMEGKPILIKKTGEIVHPADGFTVIATANTKGQGSEDGRFNAANILDEAFLERFVVVLEQPYPPKNTEKRIIIKHMKKYGVPVEDHDFASTLVLWSDAIRKTYEDGGVDDLISTRRLCHITQSFSIFTDRRKAINLCTARFVEDIKVAFLDLYDKIDPTEHVDEDSQDVPSVEMTSHPDPF